jgi:hypothetical protein
LEWEADGSGPGAGENADAETVEHTGPARTGVRFVQPGERLHATAVLEKTPSASPR